MKTEMEKETIYDKFVIELRNNRKPVVSECMANGGCAHIEGGNKSEGIESLCGIYAFPGAKHSIAGGCPKATNKVDKEAEAKERFVNPQKAAKEWKR